MNTEQQLAEALDANRRANAAIADIANECARYAAENTLLKRELNREPWTIEDPRMLREQCRIGDVAFQHLFCESKGKPVPDWVTNGLPKMYHALEEIERLKIALEARS